MTPTQQISKAILDKITSVATVNGIAFNDRLAVQTAVDHVLGAGTFDRIVSEIYDRFRAKAEG